CCRRRRWRCARRCARRARGRCGRGGWRCCWRSWRRCGPSSSIGGGATRTPRRRSTTPRRRARPAFSTRARRRSRWSRCARRASCSGAARGPARVSHPNVVQVFDVGSEDIGYVAMEYVEGCTLEAMLRDLQARDEPLPLPQTIAIVAAICRALDAAMEAHDDRGQRRPLVHGSLKPSNVLVGRHNAVKLTDFGAPPSASDRQAPEQYAGKAPDRRSDVYALGLILHELSTGRRTPPPPGDTLQWPPLPAPSEVRPGSA